MNLKELTSFIYRSVREQAIDMILVIQGRTKFINNFSTIDTVALPAVRYTSHFQVKLVIKRLVSRVKTIVC
mgnify:CR=1 FL=1